MCVCFCECVRATDTPRPTFTSANTEIVLPITIIDVNIPPFLASAPSFAFPENTLPHNYSTVGTVVYTVVADNLDRNQNHTYRYTLVGGNNNTAFLVRACQCDVLWLCAYVHV